MFCIDRTNLLTEAVGQDLLPKIAFGPTTAESNLLDWDLKLADDLETFTKRVGDPLHDRAGQMPAGVLVGHPDETSPGEWIGMGGAFPGQVGQEEQAFGSRAKSRGFLSENLVGIDSFLGSQILANVLNKPLERTCGR